MKQLAIVALVLAACGTEYQRTDGGGSGSGVDDGRSGEALFAENCSQCHGPDGQGNEAGPQILNPVRPYATWVTRNGRGLEMPNTGFEDEMPAHDTDAISDAGLVRVMDYLSAATKPTDGAGLYTRFCGNCHGADAWGGRSEQDVQHEWDEAREAIRGEEEDELAFDSDEGPAGYGDREEYMPTWSPTEITDPEIELITTYLRSLPRNPAEEKD